MGKTFDEFEKRYTDKWFAAGWVEVGTRPQEVAQIQKKDLQLLQAELAQIQEHIETVAQKQLVLKNLAKLYE